MITGTYPILGGEDRLIVSIGTPESDPLSTHGDRRCKCNIEAPYLTRSFYVHGVDDMQCVYLALKSIREIMMEYEEQQGVSFAYQFFHDR